MLGEEEPKRPSRAPLKVEPRRTLPFKGGTGGMGHTGKLVKAQAVVARHPARTRHPTKKRRPGGRLWKGIIAFQLCWMTNFLPICSA